MGLGIGRIVNAPTWQDLRSRLISALILGVVSLGLLMVGGWPFRLFCCLSGVIVWREWCRMTRANSLGLLHTIARYCFYVSLAAFLFRFNFLSIVILVASACAIALVDARQRRTNWLVGGMVYASLASLAPGMLRSDDLPGLLAMGLVVCVTWPTDIFAYFAGRTIGGPKILPRISPKKTVSGAVGGLAAGVLFGTGFYVWAAGEFSWVIVIFTAILSVLGQAGDFFESWIKRRFGVKDSGTLIPGHGGLMDRVDGLVVAIGFAWVVGMLMVGFLHPAHAIFTP